MPDGSTAIALDEFAFRVVESAEPNAWVVAIVDRPTFVTSLCAEIELLHSHTETQPAVVAINSVGGLMEAVHSHPRGTLIVVGVERFSAAQWRSLDANRSRLMRDDIAILILDECSAGRLENAAPNVASWVGGRVWQITDDSVAPSLLPHEIDQRLAALRAWGNCGDAEVIRLAEAGQLPKDPEYAEWLILLGRGELLVT